LKSVERDRAVYNHEEIVLDTYMEQYNQLTIHTKQDIVITGNDLLQWCGKKGGAWVATYIQRIEQEIIARTLENEIEVIKEAVLSWEKLEISSIDKKQ